VAADDAPAGREPAVRIGGGGCVAHAGRVCAAAAARPPHGTRRIAVARRAGENTRTRPRFCGTGRWNAVPPARSSAASTSPPYGAWATPTTTTSTRTRVVPRHTTRLPSSRLSFCMAHAAALLPDGGSVANGSGGDPRRRRRPRGPRHGAPLRRAARVAAPARADRRRWAWRRRRERKRRRAPWLREVVEGAYLKQRFRLGADDHRFSFSKASPPSSSLLRSLVALRSFCSSMLLAVTVVLLLFLVGCVLRSAARKIRRPR
jgi:hypothetical protein